MLEIATETLSGFSSSQKTPVKSLSRGPEKHGKAQSVLYGAYALSENNIPIISMSTLKASIPILLHEFIWSKISKFRGETTKSIDSAGNCFSRSESSFATTGQIW